jgi:glycine dehydrogenase subunit 2
MCGMMLIKAALEDQEGGQRKRVLVPESAHGTNPATAAALGFQVQSIPSNARGRTDLAAFKAALGSDVAAIMLTRRVRHSEPVRKNNSPARAAVVSSKGRMPL